VKVTPAWRVLPDASSRVALGSYHERAVVYLNRLDGKIEQARQQPHTGSAGVEAYGGVSNLIVDANTISDCRHGVFAMGQALDQPRKPGSMLPSLFQLYVNNLIVRSRFATMITGGGDVASELAGFGYLFRGNAIGDALGAMGQFVLGGKGHNIDMVVFDQTAGFDLAAGFDFSFIGAVGRATGSLLLRDDRFDRGVWPGARAAAVAAPGASGEATALWMHDTSWEGFARAIDAPGRSALELPQRVQNVHVRAGGSPRELSLPLLNPGTAAGSYAVQVEPEARWLRSASAQIELGPQECAMLRLTCDPRGLAPGEYRAGVRIGAMSASVRLTVVASKER
jgi:hypothetical protein